MRHYHCNSQHDSQRHLEHCLNSSILNELTSNWSMASSSETAHGTVLSVWNLSRKENWTSSRKKKEKEASPFGQHCTEKPHATPPLAWPYFTAGWKEKENDHWRKEHCSTVLEKCSGVHPTCQPEEVLVGWIPEDCSTAFFKSITNGGLSVLLSYKSDVLIKANDLADISLLFAEISGNPSRTFVTIVTLPILND